MIDKPCFTSFPWLCVSDLKLPVQRKGVEEYIYATVLIFECCADAAPEFFFAPFDDCVDDPVGAVGIRSCHLHIPFWL